MMRVFASALALISLFWFPWLVTLILMFVASFFFPFSGLIIGILADSVYGASITSGIPYGTLAGILAFVCGVVFQRFGKARIMQA